MLGIKNFFKKQVFYPQFLFPKTRIDRFPSAPVASWRIKARLDGVIYKLKEQKKNDRLAHLFVYPQQMAVEAWQKLLPYSPNNLGNWSIKDVKPDQETAFLEKELIWKMVDLYHGKKQDWEGYVTSGGTEANIFSAWLGRKFLLSKGIKREQIILIRTSITHYSLEKAADVVDVPTFVTGLNLETWSMSVEGLEKTIKNLVDRGYRGFLLPLTLGYTITGTADAYEEICQKVNSWQERWGINFFIWVDAALNGLIEPFLNERFAPLVRPEIQSFLTDFHKFGQVPIPAGVVVYRKELRQLIEKPIDYLVQKDNTLLGSRSGIAPVACWVIINALGKTGFRKIVDRCLEDKINFLAGFRKKFPKALIVNREMSLNLAVATSGSQKSVADELSKKMHLKAVKVKISFNGRKREALKTLYKLYFLRYE